MKLPPQIAAVVREGRFWSAGRSSAHGVSASIRHDINVCERGGGAAGPDKCAPGYSVCKCDSGACQCCQQGCENSRDGSGKCACT